MIVDAVIFSGEMEMLEFRMRLLAPCVDLFVVVEGDRTFQGTPREWTFSQVKPHSNLDARLASLDPNVGPWEREAQQRNGIEQACAMLDDDDLVIISDMDEIPSREAMEALKYLPPGPKVCHMFPFYYNFRCLWSDMNSGSTISTVKAMRQFSPQGLRNLRIGMPAIEKAGWHLSYFGGTKQIQEKLKSFSHEEYNRPEFLDEAHLTRCQHNGSDLLKRTGNTSRQVGRDFFPDYFVEAANPNWF